MTDKTQPEALRLANNIHCGDSACKCSLNLAAAELLRQHARIVELEAQLEAIGAGGVQALSAAPAVLPPYPPLPMQFACSGVFAVYSADQMRAYVDADRAARAPADSGAAPAEQQAAPKAAPGEQNTVPAECLEQAYREGWAACRDAETIGEEAEDWAFGNSTANSRMIDAQQAAPQQEVQEPVAWESTTPCYIKYITQARYEKFSPAVRRWYKPYKCSNCSAPQPAPAPLSDDTKRLEWLNRNIFCREMSEWDAKYGHGPDYNMWVVFSPKGVQGSARNIIDAAIAAQRGNK